MALEKIGTVEDDHTHLEHEVCIDTDDLEQPEYHYYCKAISMGKFGVASLIMFGELSATRIEHSEKYSWLADKKEDGTREGRLWV